MKLKENSIEIYAFFNFFKKFTKVVIFSKKNWRYIIGGVKFGSVQNI